jgi:hypothetical protein
MKTRTSGSWVIALSLMSILSALVGTIPTHAQPATAPGSVGSHPGGSQERLIPAKPRSSHPDGALRSRQSSDIPDQTAEPSVRARALEERLRRGQMERPIAQGEMSDRLEQLYSGSAGRSAGETPPGQSVQRIEPD